MKRAMLLVLISAGLLAGCGEKTPKCSSDDAKNLVVNIARKQINKQFEQLRNSQMSGMLPGNTDSLLLKVINIRTLSHNSSIDTYQCAANLQMTLTDEQSKLPNTTELPITYNIQKTDDNNGQFYINVSGL
ncbi:TPA: hypothetical protein G8N74_000882 [Salmonella enterica]|uniref:Lipoprotein n=1 Tax=Salmonella enterica TaxID=28901 RepID=A0A743VDG1_SALER|nr:hypothetical protein [Salmonella enterica]EAW1200650.1 hypothetical protein [Salmonella enterica subsp. enterica]EDE3111617.1 hypothetical protein [Salmonella enterica subsp. enterica serovar Muenchen]EAQ5764545.1 hypothetical protein [Salmonella enterica]EAW7808536.1 hypothetical protein [Salmonella enterica]